MLLPTSNQLVPVADQAQRVVGATREVALQLEIACFVGLIDAVERTGASARHRQVSTLEPYVHMSRPALTQTNSADAGARSIMKLVKRMRVGSPKLTPLTGAATDWSIVTWAAANWSVVKPSKLRPPQEASTRTPFVPLGLPPAGAAASKVQKRQFWAA